MFGQKKTMDKASTNILAPQQQTLLKMQKHSLQHTAGYATGCHLYPLNSRRRPIDKILSFREASLPPKQGAECKVRSVPACFFLYIIYDVFVKRILSAEACVRSLYLLMNIADT